VNDKEVAKKALADLDSAYIDVTIHAQAAFALVRYVRDLEMQLRALQKQIAAAAQSATAEVLDKPAKVGCTRFGIGVKWSTVIGAAQRHYEYEVTPEKEAARIANAKTVIESIQRGDYSTPPERALTAQLNAAYAALDAVTDWAKQEDENSETGSGTRLLALLLRHGVHPRDNEDKP
jgi:hypothetical protein